MASRAVGALLAVSAAALVAVSLATSAWWDGHPRVDGHTITAKDVHVGLWAATGCNTGGIGNCEAVNVADTFAIAGLAELALAGIAALLALVLAISAARDGKRKKAIAKVVLGATVLAAAGGGMLLILGPAIQSEKVVDLPIGWGMMMFWGGIAAASLAAVATLASRPEPLRLKTAQGQRMPAQPPPFDMHDMLREQHGTLRPSSLGPEPILGGALADMRIDSDALGQAPTPLISRVPTLRALYDQDGAGLVPSPPKPVLPTRAPTPISRAAVGALVGIPTPPGVPAAEPRTISSLPPPPSNVFPRAESEPIEPPPPPAPPPPAPPPRAPPPPRSPIGRTTPPPLARPKPPSLAPTSRPQIPLPARGSAPGIPTEKRSKPTIAHAIPPPPVSEPHGPRLETEQDGRLADGMRETASIDSVGTAGDELDAKQARTTKPRIAAPAAPPVEAPDPEDRTDVGVVIARPGFAGHIEPATSQTSTAEQPVAAPPPEPATAAAPPPPKPAPVVAPPPPAAVPLSTAPATLPPPKTAQVATSGPTPACPQCESPMAWVEEHLRFYCKQCRMYF
jgi:hypothetical protein